MALSAPTTNAISSLKDRILERLSQFESYQDNPAWQADCIAEIATNNAPSTLESLKQVRQEIFDSIEKLPDDLADGRLVRRNKNTSQRFTLIKDVIALFNFTNLGQVSKDLKDCIRPNHDNGSSSQSCGSGDTTLSNNITPRKDSLDETGRVATLPVISCFLCESAICSESDDQSQVCRHCKMLPDTVKFLVDKVKRLEVQIPSKENDYRNSQDDLAREVQRLRDENASLVQIIKDLTNEKTDVNKSSEWCHVNEGRSTQRHNKHTWAEDAMSTSNRFAALDGSDDVQLASSEECGTRISDQHDDQIDLYRKHQQQRFYQSKAQGKTVIIGDSMIKDLKPNKMSKNRSVRCFTHRGARIEQLHSPARRIVSTEDPPRIQFRRSSTNSRLDNNYQGVWCTDRSIRSHLPGRYGSRTDTPDQPWSRRDVRSTPKRTWNRPTGYELDQFFRGEKQSRVRVGTSYSDAVRSATTTAGFQGRGAPTSRWKFRTAEHTRLLRLAERL
ncbi:hypothetical protein Bbelb_154980 [Branchiostoma belcheri]|nr:hypothetical protein Bbelb_154980 [Branchiostoma belcheri]